MKNNVHPRSGSRPEPQRLRGHHPALRAVCQAVARPTLPKHMLAGLLCSAGLLTGSGAAFAGVCLPQAGGGIPLFTVGDGETCSNLIIGYNIGIVLAAPETAKVENRGAITYDRDLSNKYNTQGAAITLYGRNPDSVNSSEKNEITNYNSIDGGLDGSGIYVDSSATLTRLTNNEGASISGLRAALQVDGDIKEITNSGLLQGKTIAISNTNGDIHNLQNSATGEIIGETSAIRNSSLRVLLPPPASPSRSSRLIQISAPPMAAESRGSGSSGVNPGV